MAFDVTRLTLADLIYNVTEYLIDSEADDYRDNHKIEQGYDDNDNHIYVHALELLHRLNKEFELTDWEANL